MFCNNYITITFLKFNPPPAHYKKIITLRRHVGINFCILFFVLNVSVIFPPRFASYAFTFEADTYLVNL